MLRVDTVEREDLEMPSYIAQIVTTKKKRLISFPDFEASASVEVGRGASDRSIYRIAREHLLNLMITTIREGEEIPEPAYLSSNCWEVEDIVVVLSEHEVPTYRDVHGVDRPEPTQPAETHRDRRIRQQKGGSRPAEAPPHTVYTAVVGSSGLSRTVSLPDLGVSRTIAGRTSYHSLRSVAAGLLAQAASVARQERTRLARPMYTGPGIRVAINAVGHAWALPADADISAEARSGGQFMIQQASAGLALSALSAEAARQGARVDGDTIDWSGAGQPGSLVAGQPGSLVAGQPGAPVPRAEPHNPAPVVTWQPPALLTQPWLSERDPLYRIVLVSQRGDVLVRQTRSTGYAMQLLGAAADRRVPWLAYGTIVEVGCIDGEPESTHVIRRAVMGRVRNPPKCPWV